MDENFEMGTNGINFQRASHFTESSEILGRNSNQTDIPGHLYLLRKVVIFSGKTRSLKFYRNSNRDFP